MPQARLLTKTLKAIRSPVNFSNGGAMPFGKWTVRSVTLLALRNLSGLAVDAPLHHGYGFPYEDDPEY